MNSFSALCGRRALLPAAALALAAGLATSATAGGVVTVKPIKICNNAGMMCANDAEKLFLAETNKIWKQAGIEFKFKDFSTYNNTDRLNFEDQAEVDKFFMDKPGADADANVITMWFTGNIFDAFGEVNTIGGNLTLIDSSIFTLPRIDTIAHELGHNLGLKHDDPGVEKDFLMRAGDRTVPGAIGDITPTGAKLDKLTDKQKMTAMADKKVKAAVPEPATWAMMLLGFGALGATLRRRRAAVPC